jgi:hypothetical protein
MIKRPDLNCYRYRGTHPILNSHATPSSPLSEVYETTPSGGFLSGAARSLAETLRDRWLPRDTLAICCGRE